jgi:hypothetical protein
MWWFQLTRLTGEAGSSESSTLPVWVNGDSIQFIQPAAGGCRLYLRSGALNSIDVQEKFEEILDKCGKMG